MPINRVIAFAFAATSLLGVTANEASAVESFAIDREYGFGEIDTNASIGQPVAATITGEPGVYTFDNIGSIGVGDLQDMRAFGSPVYVNTSSRPDNPSTTFGISFDGTDDYLVTSNLNLPSTSQATPDYDDWEGSVAPSPLRRGETNYNGITNRFLQFWARPNLASLSNAQSVVMDSNQHGVRIEGGKWSMRYAGVDYPGVDGAPESTATSTWQHVMLARPSIDVGSILYIDGIAVAAAEGGYDGGANEQLVVGSNTSRTEDNVFDGGTEEYYHGDLDELTMWVIGQAGELSYTDDGGFPQTLPAADYGEFDPAVDNGYIRDIYLGTQGNDLLDFDGNGTVQISAGPGDNDGGDIDAFVAGWMSQQLINGVPVGDLKSLKNGDVNFDGITDLADLAKIRQLNAPFAAAIATALEATAVPEPQSLLIGLTFSISMLAARSRR